MKINSKGFSFNRRKTTSRAFLIIQLLLVFNFFTFLNLSANTYNLTINKGNEQVVSGTVTDEEGEPIPGVNIMIKGTTEGTITDLSGAYSITVPSSESVLIFSYMGYQTQEIIVVDQQTINVKLEVDATGLDEVVVVGYGTAKKETLTGSITTIKSKDITAVPVTNVSNSLAGKMSGLSVVSSSGEPGSDNSTLRIRGSNTLNDNSALVIVDGVPGRDLNRIDPHSIESLTILKDASAAIYGSRAANGVILITTKRGKLGKPEISFSVEHGFSQPTRLPELTDAATYATMINEVASYEGSSPEYTDQDIQLFRDGTSPYTHPNTDWFEECLKTWSAQSSQNVGISGGTEKMKYFVSLGAKQQDGIYKNSANFYNQYNIRSNIDGAVTDNINVGVNLSGRLEDRSFPVRDANENFRGMMQSYPTFIAQWPTGEAGPALEAGRNPIATASDLAGTDRQKKYVLNVDLKLDVKIPWVKGLSFNGNFSLDQRFDFNKKFEKPYELYALDHIDANGDPVLISNTYGGGTGNTPSLRQEFKSNSRQLYFGVLNYETVLGEKHNLKLMAGSQFEKGFYQDFNAYRDEFLSTAIQEMFAGQTANQQTGGTGNKDARLSYFGRINYNFANKYLVELVGRYDGSYIFPEENRWGFFPAASVGWVVSEESFWQDNISFIDFFKIRSSLGQTGNDRVDPYQFLTPYIMGKYQLNNDWPQPFVTYDGSNFSELATAYEGVKANPDITWEVADQFDVGFSADLLNSKLSIEAAYFVYKRSNILWAPNATVPRSTGIDLPDTNYGKVSNKGFDFDITYRDETSGGFSYSVSFNGMKATNTVEEWGEPENIPEHQQTTGHPMGSVLLYKTDGIYHTQADVDAHLATVSYDIGSPQPGDIKFVDYNGDGIINGDDRVRTFKNSFPKFTYGSNINLAYKGFDLSILLQGSTGGVVYMNNEAGRFGNYFQSFADARWTPDNTSATGPRAYNRRDFYWKSNNNDYFLKKTNYIRLKNLQLGYTLPKNIVEKAGIQNARVYISGYNLLTYSPDMKDFDPEMSANTTDRDGGAFVDGRAYPLLKVISMGLSVRF